MGLTEIVWKVVLLSLMAGGVHVLAPDHWLPASVLAWQRGWSLRRSLFFGIGAFLLHVLLGAGVYFCFRSFLSQLHAERLFMFSLVLVFAVMLLRLIRFSKVRDVFHKGPSGRWAVFSVFSLLGPCETLIPILIKSGQLGIGYILPFVAFTLGTVTVGSACVLFGRLLWNKPLWLPRGMNWGHRGSALVPLAAGLAVGISVILRIS